MDIVNLSINAEYMVFQDYPTAVAAKDLAFLIGFTTLLKPLIVLLNGAANAVLHAMGIEPAEERIFINCFLRFFTETYFIKMLICMPFP